MEPLHTVAAGLGVEWKPFSSISVGKGQWVVPMGDIEQAGSFSSASTIHPQASQVLLSWDCFKRTWKLLCFPGGSVGKERACNAGDWGSTPGSGRSLGEANGNPLQCSFLGNPMDRGAWWAMVHGGHKSRMRLNHHQKYLMPRPHLEPIKSHPVGTRLWFCFKDFYLFKSFLGNWNVDPRLRNRVLTPENALSGQKKKENVLSG